MRVKISRRIITNIIPNNKFVSISKINKEKVFLGVKEYSSIKEMGYRMSKEFSVKINDKLYKNLHNNKLKRNEIITKALYQFFENKEQNNEIVTTLKGNVQILEKQSKSLEIDKICLMQENKNLKTRIDDLAQLYPSAIALLGNSSESRQIRKNKLI
jgi:hypothetical protein